jgi:hypothetical protein
MFKTGSSMIDAEHAFTRASRAGRRAALLRAVRRDSEGAQLPVLSARNSARGAAGIREIPLEAITGTLEPTRAAQFDAAFRPIRRALRSRWERIWIAEERGAVLPPISVVPVGAVYAVRDGHHRVSVARARGAIAIDGVVEAI